MTRRPFQKDPSGRFLLRIDPGLHGVLRRAAASAGVSLNDFCARVLAGPSGSASLWQGAADAVRHAAVCVGSALVGVVAFGSWARGEERAGSDIDLLVVVDGVDVTRALYRCWDDTELLWEGRPVEPHFVRLPAADEVVAGLWAEVAIDGIILFVRDRALPARLARVRRDIISGRVVRRLADGHPYWVKAA